MCYWSGLKYLEIDITLYSSSLFVIFQQKLHRSNWNITFQNTSHLISVNEHFYRKPPTNLKLFYLRKMCNESEKRAHMKKDSQRRMWKIVKFFLIFFFDLNVCCKSNFFILMRRMLSLFNDKIAKQVCMCVKAIGIYSSPVYLLTALLIMILFKPKCTCTSFRQRMLWAPKQIRYKLYI